LIVTLTRDSTLSRENTLSCDTDSVSHVTPGT